MGNVHYMIVEHDGGWAYKGLEAGFGALEGLDHPTYADLDAAQEGINQRLTRGR